MYRVRRWMVTTAMAVWALSAQALPMYPEDPEYPGDPEGEYEDPGPPVPTVSAAALQCLQSATASLSATPLSIKLGDSVQLDWSVQFPANCGATYDIAVFLNQEFVGATGSKLMQPMADTQYMLTLDLAGLVTRSLTGTITTIRVALPPVVHITGHTSEWISLFVQAVGTPNTLVLLAEGINMDLTGFGGIHVVEGVTISSRACRRVAAPLHTAVGGSLETAFVDWGETTAGFCGMARDASHLGPRIFTRSRPKPLFSIQCNGENIFGNNVRMLGFRLQGPHFETEEGDDNTEIGIMIDSCIGIEIAYMELAGWSGSAISVQENLRPSSSPGDVRIHDNFIHHNQHKGSLGYGVVTGIRAAAQIERNVFDFNRHAIAASGDSTGYDARENLVLKGGGRHAKWYNEFTHQFDVHGTGCWWSSDLCGDAGVNFSFIRNAFQYRNDYAIKIRGRPLSHAFIAENVFPHEGLEDDWGDDAIALHTTENVTIGSGNVIEVDTYGQYGVCDFDGDGTDDLFLATGVTWWYASGGKMHWTYLRNATEYLHQVALGDFDGDRRCDVFAVNRFAQQWEISKGGRGEWTALPGTYDLPFEELRFGDFNGDGRQDIFWRAPDSQWWATSPGVYDWTALQSSWFALDKLRFGDFNNDGVTDVIAVQGGRWSVSWGAQTPWQNLNPTLSTPLEPLRIGDINGDGRDDIVRDTVQCYAITQSAVQCSYSLQVSWGGSTSWQPLTNINLFGNVPVDVPFPVSFLGQFDAQGGSDVLVLDARRMGHLYRYGASGFVPYSLYAY